MHDKRTKLSTARKSLGLSLRDAGQLVGVSHQTVALYEYGGGRNGQALAQIRDLCRAYMALAAELGYSPDEFHESQLCPGEFPAPARTGQEVS
jgi:transcriptional regulator with XRE-family HTH domain